VVSLDTQPITQNQFLSESVLQNQLTQNQFLTLHNQTHINMRVFWSFEAES